METPTGDYRVLSFHYWKGKHNKPVTAISVNGILAKSFLWTRTAVSGWLEFGASSTDNDFSVARRNASSKCR